MPPPDVSSWFVSQDRLCDLGPLEYTQTERLAAKKCRFPQQESEETLFDAHVHGTYILITATIARAL
jgi:hypothetical protein